MNRLLAFMVVLLMGVDLFTLAAVQKLRGRTPPPDLTPRMDQMEKDLSQAQADIGELKQEVNLLARRGQAAD